MSHKNTSPYCYLIGWSQHNRYYYGVRFGQGCHPKELWKTYFTSSSLVKKYRRKYGDPDIIQIRKVFHQSTFGSIASAQHAAVKHEQSVIRRMKMVESEIYLNCSNNIQSRTGVRITNHRKYRMEKYGSYHSVDGTESMKRHNREYTKNNNPMHDPKIKEKHSEAIAQKLGYKTHKEYLSTVKEAFLEFKTVKTTAEMLGHSQYTIRHLLPKLFIPEELVELRKEGARIAREKSKQIPRRKRDIQGSCNPNAYIWQAISPCGNIHIIKGNRLSFCRKNNIGTSLDPLKPHLRKGWAFVKLCRVKDYCEE